VAEVIAEREKMLAALSGRPGWVAYPSDANFILARPPQNSGVVRRWLEAGIVVRTFSEHGRLAGCARITIGTPEENLALLRLL
jgi:histidinol-phosphate aminotransferase